MYSSGWKTEVSITLPIVFQCPFQRSQWIDKSKNWEKVSMESWMRCSHTWVGTAQTARSPFGQVSLLSDDNLTEQRSPSCPKLGQQQEGIGALQLQALCILQRPLVIRTGTQRPHRKSCSLTKPFFPQLSIFITKRQRLCVMKVQRI